jgi:hypothetical protein
MDKNHYMINMQKVLYMAAVLHTRGYEKLHVIPSLSPTGLSWRCVFMTMDTESVIVSNWIVEQLDINAKADIEVLELANRFEREHFYFLRSCIGSDRRYVDWYSRMLDGLEEEELPYALSDFFSPCEYWLTSSDKRIITLPYENRFLNFYLKGKETPDGTQP